MHQGQKTQDVDDRLLFGILIALQLIFYAYLIAAHRMVKGHDAFIHFSLQYYFLNNAVITGEVPQWIPFMTHGSLALWWYPIQAGILQNICLCIAPLLKHINFYYIYNAGMFLDELLLLTGTWLLARRVLQPIGAFFTALTVTGSCIWTSQPWYNFHFYYALPLVLFLGHRFIDTGRWRYLLLAGNLLALQTLGNLPYYIPVTTLLVVVYFLLYTAFNQSYVQQQIRQLRPNARAVIVLLAVAAGFLAAYLLLKTGSGEIMNYNQGRSLNSTTDLKGFLQYGANNEAKKWLELAAGISPSEDYTLYMGILALPLMLLGLLRMKRPFAHVPCIIVFCILLSSASPLATLCYHLWPLMKYYRHLSLISSLTKLFLCFLAGYGMDALIAPLAAGQKSLTAQIVLKTAAIILLGFAAYLFCMSYRYDAATQWLHEMSRGLIKLGRYEVPIPTAYNSVYIRNVLSPDVLHWQLMKSAVLCLLAAALSLAIGGSRRRAWPGLIALVLIVQAADLLEYKINETQLRTTVLRKPYDRLLNFQPMPYPVRRSSNFFADNPRGFDLWQLVPPLGIRHWTLNAFLFKDDVDHPYRTDYWLRPMDKLIRALYGQPLNDLSIKSQAWSASRWNFPDHDPVVAKIAGVSEDKIQFFSSAFASSSDEETAQLIHQHLEGEHLLINSGDTQLNDRAPEMTNDPQSLSTPSDRVRLPYKVVRFSANHLDVDVSNTQGKPIWLYYADVWHPFWKATVNGHRATVLRANLAYKAVLLDNGLNHVQFRFQSKGLW